MVINPVIEHLCTDALHVSNVSIDILRLDQIHPQISGNKYFKLLFHHQAALAAGHESFITFGGAYSNHLHATAYFGKCNAIKTIGIVRGDELSAMSNDTLRDCEEWGMELHFVSRDEYDQGVCGNTMLQLLENNNATIIPEGGSSVLGRDGAATIAAYIPDVYDYVVVSVGSGTTIAGIANGLSHHQSIKEILGFVPMKSGKYLAHDIEEWRNDDVPKIRLIDEYHFGGFGRYDDTLIDFISSIYDTVGIPLDIVYNGKMMYGLLSMVKQNYFSRGSRIMIIHTGGLQGNRSVTSLTHLSNDKKSG